MVRGFPKFQINKYGEVRNRTTGNLVTPYLSEIGGVRHSAVMLAHRGVERRLWVFELYELASF